MWVARHEFHTSWAAAPASRHRRYHWLLTSVRLMQWAGRWLLLASVVGLSTSATSGTMPVLAHACTTALMHGKGNHAVVPVGACSGLALHLLLCLIMAPLQHALPCTPLHRRAPLRSRSSQLPKAMPVEACSALARTSAPILPCPCQQFFQQAAGTARCTRGSLLALPELPVLGIWAGCVAHWRTPLPCTPTHTHLSTLFLTLSVHLGRPVLHGAPLCPAWLEPSRACLRYSG